MDKDQLKKDALEYHSTGQRGKIEVAATKPCNTQKDLSLAYTPGVAEPCRVIEKEPETVWEYTSRSNLVAVVSDGTAVLGLGDIGPLAGIPVMEGKCVLFKRFADVDAFPLCIEDVRVNGNEGRTDPKRVIDFVKMVEPTFGGVNLEDIGAPACFEIEEALKKETNIPIFHDDQHGTAIITLAGLLNGLEMAGKKIGDIKVVFNGAGAAGIACAKYYVSAGVRKENITMCDSKGVIYSSRSEGMNPYKEEFAADTDARTLAEALKNANVFIGVSVAGCVTRDMVKGMADKPIVYAMANPVPEIYPEDAFEAGAYIVGTGRSDFPNQVNNVLGFPGIFRGALDAGATDINEDMKMGASRALSEIAKEKVPDDIKEFLSKAYPGDAANGMFDPAKPLSKDYIIPKPLDPRVVPRVARYVAEAAMNSGVARDKIDDFDTYENEVAKRVALKAAGKKYVK